MYDRVVLLHVARDTVEGAFPTMLLNQSLLKFTILPLLIAVLAIVGLVQHRAHRLAEQQAAIIEESFLTAKRAELKHYLDLARSAISGLYDSGRNDAAAQDEVKSIVRSLRFGDDGYFFIYDLAGNNLVHPKQADLVGRNLLNMTDSAGRYVIRSLLETAQQGDGYQRYGWEKPSTQRVVEKLGYVTLLERWGWMIGTGIYLDDVERATQAVRERAVSTLQTLVTVALIAVVMVFMCGLALSLSEYRLAQHQLKAMHNRSLMLHEEERELVSGELHDGIKQQLIGIKFILERAQKKMQQGELRVDEELREGVENVSKAIVAVRDLSHNLRPAVLDTPRGLPAALLQLAKDFERRDKFKVTFENSLNDPALPKHIVEALFRIAQEALNNIDRHAEATLVTIRLSLEGSCVCMVITDNGRRFSVSELNRFPGIGLRIIGERTKFLRGSFNVTSTPGCTQLMISLPFTTQGD